MTARISSSAQAILPTRRARPWFVSLLRSPRSPQKLRGSKAFVSCLLMTSRTLRLSSQAGFAIPRRQSPGDRSPVHIASCSAGHTKGCSAGHTKGRAAGHLKSCPASHTKGCPASGAYSPSRSEPCHLGTLTTSRAASCSARPCSRASCRSNWRQGIKHVGWHRRRGCAGGHWLGHLGDLGIRERGPLSAVVGGCG